MNDLKDLVGIQITTIKMYGTNCVMREICKSFFLVLKKKCG